MTLAWLKEVGYPDETIKEALEVTVMGSERVAPFQPETAMVDTPLTHGGWSLDMVHTRDHSPGHICLYATNTQTLFAGDHLFPSINANASYRIGSQGDPLQEDFDSLDYLGQRKIERVMPGRQSPFGSPRPRIDVLRGRHRRHLRMTLELVRSGHRMIWQIAGALVRSRHDWTAVPTGSRLAAGETCAHLLWLENHEYVTCNRSAVPRQRYSCMLHTSRVAFLAIGRRICSVCRPPDSARCPQSRHHSTDGGVSCPAARGS